MRDDQVQKGGVLSLISNSLFVHDRQLHLSGVPSAPTALVRCSRRKLAVEVEIPVATTPEALVSVWTRLHMKTTTRMQITHICSPFLFSELVGAQLANALATLRSRRKLVHPFSGAPLCH